MNDRRHGEGIDLSVITTFLLPNELIQTAHGWVTARDWLTDLQRRDFKGCPTEIVTAGRSNRIALRRCDHPAKTA